MEAHNRKPLYFRSEDPLVAHVDEIASKLFQWDETVSKPLEVGQGKSWMPPLETEGEYIVWSDTHTLGYEAEGVAGPIFFSDGGLGDAKILQIINAVAYRLGESMFNDVAAAKAWALTETRIYVKDDSVNAPGPLSFTNTNVKIYLRDSGSLGDVNSQLFTNAQDLKEAIYNWFYSPNNNGSTGSTYKYTDPDLAVNTQLYNFNESINNYTTGFRFHADFGDFGYKIINWNSGIAQQVWNIGNIQGIINDGSDGLAVI